MRAGEILFFFFHGALRPQKPQDLLGTGERGWGKREIIGYTVTTRMTLALRWAATRVILMFHYCEGQSHKTVSTNHNFFLKEKERRKWNRAGAFCLPA